MRQTIVFVIMAALLASAATAAVSNVGFDNECSSFYDSNNYYSIAKWVYSNETNNYILEEQNSLYSYYGINVYGNLIAADWTSDPKVSFVIMNAGDESIEFNGGTAGYVNSITDINHITLCGHTVNKRVIQPNNGCVGVDCGGNGVPEFSVITLGAAVLAVTLGLVFIRKR
jgi:hypothetical protein